VEISLNSATRSRSISSTLFRNRQRRTTDILKFARRWRMPPYRISSELETKHVCRTSQSLMQFIARSSLCRRCQGTGKEPGNWLYTS
jgi:hypothetical protein